jgi:hypothetical protein
LEFLRYLYCSAVRGDGSLVGETLASAATTLFIRAGRDVDNGKPAVVSLISILGVLMPVRLIACGSPARSTG